jgi:hypothetical protein
LRLPLIVPSSYLPIPVSTIVDTWSHTYSRMITFHIKLKRRSPVGAAQPIRA